jgi:hypothetical protein
MSFCFGYLSMGGVGDFRCSLGFVPPIVAEGLPGVIVQPVSVIVGKARVRWVRDGL